MLFHYYCIRQQGKMPGLGYCVISTLSKHTRFDLHSIQISLEVLARSRPNGTCTLACFWTRSIWPETENLTQSAKTKSDPCHLNATESKSGKLVAGRLRSARTRLNDSCTLACFQTRCFWPKPDQAIQIGTRLVLHSMIHASFGRTEPNWMWEVRSGIYIYDLAQFWLHTGHNGHSCLYQTWHVYRDVSSIMMRSSDISIYMLFIRSLNSIMICNE